jgi:chorismate dehydratase
VPAKAFTSKGAVTLGKIHIGVPNHLAVRPLIFGLTRNTEDSVELLYDEPGALAVSLERREIDAALIPSIEFLRGVGEFSVPGTGLVASGPTKSLLLVADKPLGEIRRVAVDEFSRTPLVALRVVLDKLHGALPDLWVLKKRPRCAEDWRGDFDAVLLTGDDGIDYCSRGTASEETCHNVGDLWRRIYSKPLVLSVFAYNEESIGNQLRAILTASRDYGVRNMPTLCDELAKTRPFDTAFLRAYFEDGLSYRLGADEEDGLRCLQDAACEYQILQTRRLDNVLIG